VKPKKIMRFPRTRKWTIRQQMLALPPEKLVERYLAKCTEVRKLRKVCDALSKCVDRYRAIKSPHQIAMEKVSEVRVG